MKRIIFLSNEAGMGGSAFYQALNIDYLLSNGNHVVLVDEKPKYTLNYVQLQNEANFRVIKARVWSGNSEINAGLKALMKSYDKTIIALSNPGVLVRNFLILKDLKNQFKTKVIITIHSGMLSMTLRRYMLEWAASFAMLFLTKVVYVSKFTKQYWHRRYPWLYLSHSSIIPNGIKIPEVNLRKDAKGKFRIGFVGRLHPEKDPKLFCEIARFARKRTDKAEFHVFGDGPLYGILKKEYSSAVIFHGRVVEQEDIYNSIDLLLVTSPVENCPYAVLQAKSYGVPTVACSVGGISEIVEAEIDGILSRDRKIESMFDAIEKCIAKYDKLTNGCLKTRSRYSIETSAKMTWGDLLPLMSS